MPADRHGVAKKIYVSSVNCIPLKRFRRWGSRGNPLTKKIKVDTATRSFGYTDTALGQVLVQPTRALRRPLPLSERHHDHPK